jgi:hypothetical protein
MIVSMVDNPAPRNKPEKEKRPIEEPAMPGLFDGMND